MAVYNKVNPRKAPGNTKGIMHWIRDNLLSTPLNVALTALGIAILFIIIGVMIKWYFDKEDNFYFEKITLTNVLFTTLKLLILASFVILSIVSGVNIIILILASSISGYFISWHPEKFRE